MSDATHTTKTHARDAKRSVTRPPPHTPAAPRVPVFTRARRPRRLARASTPRGPVYFFSFVFARLPRPIVRADERRGGFRVRLVLRVREHEVLRPLVVPPRPGRGLRVRGVVVADEDVLHERVPLSSLDGAFPLLHLGASYLGGQHPQLLHEPVHLGRLEVFVPRADPRDPGFHRHLEERDASSAHPRPRVFRDLHLPDHARLPLHEHGPRPVEPARLLPQPRVEHLLARLLELRRGLLPQDAPAVLRHRLEVQDLRALGLEVRQHLPLGAPRLARDDVVPKPIRRP